MKLSSENIRLLGLSKSEIKVMNALRIGKNTPLSISGYARVSRPAVYEILTRLQKRGLIKSNISDGKKYWSQSKDRDLEQELYSTKRELFAIPEGVEEVHGLSDSTVVVHRGKEAVRKIIASIMKDHKNTRFFSIQGEKVLPVWNEVFGASAVDDLNRSLKKNNMISEMIFQEGVLEKNTKKLGKEWAENFEGRMAVTHYAEEQYFDHAGSIWIFKGSLYLMAMGEELIIEVRNSEIQKIVLSLFRFVQDHSRKIDVNALLRKIIETDFNEK